ncbi:MAG: lamin tail domain-containing protein [Clostridia bacterium]|nr:lamin tail domain-containing protein [Clostridia bacterium]
MNNKQKQKRAFLAIGLAILLVLIVGISAMISCGTSKCAGSQPTNSQSKSDVIVSEILVSNKQTVRDPLGTYSDYVELYNRSDRDIDLFGYGLTDDEISLWMFPSESIIHAHDYLVVWCMKNDPTNGNGYLTIKSDDGTESKVIIADFALSKNDVLRFVDPSGTAIATVDLSGFYAGQKGSANAYGVDDEQGEAIAVGGNAFAYGEDGEWSLMKPTPGFPNTEAGWNAYNASHQTESETGVTKTADCPVRVTEFMASNSSAHKAPDGSYCDWIELYNSGSSAFDLSGYSLSDDVTKPKKFTFPQGTKIEAYSYLVLYHTEKPVSGVYSFDFGLSSQGGETLIFTTNNDLIVDLIDFGVQQKNCSYARIYINNQFDPNAAFESTDKPTPGYDNTVNGRALFEEKENGPMGVHDISLNEILVNGYHVVYAYSNSTKSERPYDADLGSWIELYNRSDTTVDLSGFSITDNERKPRKWVFPDGTSIAGKGYLVLQLEGSLPREGQSEKDITADQRKYQLNFDISAEGETVLLYNAQGELIDRVIVPPVRACISYGRDATGAWKLFDTPTEGAANDTNGRGVYCEAAAVDTHSGIYRGVQTVNITVPEGCYATYTLSCGKENDPVKTTTPTESDTRVSGPIAIKENTVLRVRTFSSDNSRYPSDVHSYTYVIIGDEETVEAHNTNLPVVFLVTDPDNLWNTQYGMYVKGGDYTGKGEADEIMIGQSDKKEVMGKYANFNMRGRMWEKPATFTYLDAGGKNVLYESDLNIRIFGAFSRKIAQKGIALIARKGVGASPLQYAFFDNRPFTEYKSLVLRASGQDAALSRIRDVLVQSLLDDANVDLANQAFIQCIVYINGQYWGVYNLREKISKHYIAQHYGVEDEDTIDILKGNGNNEQCIVCSNVYESANKGLNDYKDLIAYCENHNCNLSNQSDYDYVCSQIDADQFAMYCAFEIIIGNTDTGNIKWWRSSEKDNKWRWIQYDYCWAMNGDNPSQAAESSTGFRRDYFWRYFDPAGHGAGKGFSTVLGRSMLSNNEFVKLFLKWCAYFYNEVYTPEKILAKVDYLQENIRKEMETWDLVRWRPYHNLSTKGWNSHCDKIRNYAKNYQDWYLYYCQNYINKHTNYHLSDEEMISLFGKVGKIS